MKFNKKIVHKTGLQMAVENQNIEIVNILLSNKEIGISLKGNILLLIYRIFP